MMWSCCGNHKKECKGCVNGMVRVNELFFFFKEENNNFRYDIPWNEKKIKKWAHSFK